jgi:hypothetical protein
VSLTESNVSLLASNFPYANNSLARNCSGVGSGFGLIGGGSHFWQGDTSQHMQENIFSPFSFCQEYNICLPDKRVSAMGYFGIKEGIILTWVFTQANKKKGFEIFLEIFIGKLFRNCSWVRF